AVRPEPLLLVGGQLAHRHGTHRGVGMAPSGPESCDQIHRRAVRCRRLAPSLPTLACPCPRSVESKSAGRVLRATRGQVACAAMRPSSSAVLASLLLLVGVAAAQVPSPQIEGPVTGPGTPFVETTSFDLATVGYTQEEFFISGTAHSYTNSAPLGTDGKWSVTPADSAAYETRIIVYRPTSKKKFNGTV